MKELPFNAVDAVRFFKELTGHEFGKADAMFYVGIIRGNWNVLVRGRKVSPCDLRVWIRKETELWMGKNHIQRVWPW